MIDAQGLAEAVAVAREQLVLAALPSLLQRCQCLLQRCQCLLHLHLHMHMQSAE